MRKSSDFFYKGRKHKPLLKRLPVGKTVDAQRKFGGEECEKRNDQPYGKSGRSIRRAKKKRLIVRKKLEFAPRENFRTTTIKQVTRERRKKKMQRGKPNLV